MAPAQLNENERKALNALLASLMVVRDLDKEMPAQTLQTVLEVVKNPGINQRDLEAKIGVTSAAMSRIVTRLSPERRPKEPGWNLLEARVNPMDRRFQLVYPTAKGLAFARKVFAAASTMFNGKEA